MSEPTPPALFKQREPTAILIIDIWCNLFEHIYDGMLIVHHLFQGNQVCIDALKQKLENVQASMYCDVVDANMDNRRLRRALWIARAKRAIEKIAWFKLWNASISTMNPEDGARQEFDKWRKALGKFLKKAEEYK